MEEEQPAPNPSHNNPEEAAKYLKAVTTLVDKFAEDIHGFNPCAYQVGISELYT